MPVFQRLRQSKVVLLWSLLLAGAAFAQGSPQNEALHAVNRLSFGPKPGEVARVMQLGVDRYVEEQLNPERLHLPAQLTRQLDSLRTPRMSQDDLITQYRDALQSAKKVKDAGADTGKDQRREMV